MQNRAKTIIEAFEAELSALRRLAESQTSLGKGLSEFRPDAVQQLADEQSAVLEDVGRAQRDSLDALADAAREAGVDSASVGRLAELAAHVSSTDYKRMRELAADIEAAALAVREQLQANRMRAFTGRAVVATLRSRFDAGPRAERGRVYTARGHLKGARPVSI